MTKHVVAAWAMGLAIGGIAWSGFGQTGAVPGTRPRRALEGRGGTPAVNPPPGLGAEGAEVRSHILVKTLHGHAEGLDSVAFSPDGKMLASGSHDKTVKLWDVATGKALQTWEDHASTVTALSFSPDGKYLVSGGLDQQLVVREIASGQVMSKSQQLCPVFHLAFLPDSKSFVSVCGGHLRLWTVGQTEQDQAVATEQSITTMAVTPAGEVVTGDRQGKVVSWDPNTMQTLRQKSRSQTDKGGMNSILSVCALKNGDVMVADLDWMWLWKQDTGEMVQVSKRPASGRVPLESARTQVMKLAPLGDDGLFIAASWPVITLCGKGDLFDWGFYNSHTGEQPSDDIIYGMAVSPSAELVAIARGGGLGQKQNVESKTHGQDVEIFSTSEMRKLRGGNDPDAAELKPAKVGWQ